MIRNSQYAMGIFFLLGKFRMLSGTSISWVLFFLLNLICIVSFLRRLLIFFGHSTTQIVFSLNSASVIPVPIHSSDDFARYVSICANLPACVFFLSSYICMSVNVGLLTVCVIPRACAMPLVRVVFPEPKFPSSVTTSPAFKVAPIFLPSDIVS